MEETFWRKFIAVQGLVYALAQTCWHGPCGMCNIHLQVSHVSLEGKYFMPATIRKCGPTLLPLRLCYRKAFENKSVKQS